MTENFRDLSFNGLGKIFSDALSPYSEYQPSVSVLSIVKKQMEQSPPERLRYEAYRVEIVVYLPLYDLEGDNDNEIPF